MTDRQLLLACLRRARNVITSPGREKLTPQQLKDIYIACAEVVNFCAFEIARVEDDDVFKVEGV